MQGERRPILKRKAKPQKERYAEIDQHDCHPVPCNMILVSQRAFTFSATIQWIVMPRLVIEKGAPFVAGTRCLMVNSSFL